jgi:hypothetical protein
LLRIIGMNFSTIIWHGSNTCFFGIPEDEEQGEISNEAFESDMKEPQKKY